MQMFNAEEKFEIVLKNPSIPQIEKEKILDLFKAAEQVGFGKFGRSEMYTFNEGKYPRCTAVMSMDGTKAGALMEWAKREVVSFAKENLKYALKKVDRLTDNTIDYILDQALANPDKQRDDAANVGTNEHDNVENFLNGKPYKITEQFLLFKYVWEQEKPELICTEMPLIWRRDIDFGFGGRLDILAYKNGKYIIYDLKTSKSVHQSYALQTSAYREAVNLMSGYHIFPETTKIIHIPDVKSLNTYQLKEYKKRGGLIECKNLDKAFEHYKILLKQYYNRNNKYF
ncbi:MAG: PD-(D/E)XK nuclease family protein [Clostridia bacterium]|nr:PD-(D/E)XK nuclease family protein [Clostridia bacterium]